LDRTGKNIFEANKEQVLCLAAKKYKIDPGVLKLVGGFENQIYEFAENGREYILRITDSIHRNIDQVMAEVAFIDYLVQGGLSAVRPLESPSGSLVEKIDFGEDPDGHDFYFSLIKFKKAPGGHPGAGQWTNGLFREWGCLLGKLHRLSRNYRPATARLKRREWHEDPDIDVNRFIPADQVIVREKFSQLIDSLHRLPRNQNNYGLTHNDAHNWNLHIHENRIILFDFDDCQYDWYINDLAIVLFYTLRDRTIGDGSADFARRFWRCLLEGYREESELPSEWLELVPFFLKVREMILYTIVYAEQCFDENEWVRSFMKERREMIENDIPIIDIDFAL